MNLGSEVLTSGINPGTGVVTPGTTPGSGLVSLRLNQGSGVEARIRGFGKHGQPYLIGTLPV